VATETSNEILARVRELARAIHSAGGRALIVGGWVRDELLGRDSKDLDLEVFGLAADRLRALLDSFGRVDTVGESFTVFKLGSIDVWLPRRVS
jgi:tRNA nucleotidyltransferase (CCA-adding enzyme)